MERTIFGIFPLKPYCILLLALKLQLGIPNPKLNFLLRNGRLLSVLFRSILFRVLVTTYTFDIKLAKLTIVNL